MSLVGGFAARRGYFALSGIVIVLDQVTKLVAQAHLTHREPVVVVPHFFNLWYSLNPGGLFGSFRDWSGPLRFVLLTLLPIVAIFFIAGYLTRTRYDDRPTLFGLALILGGATGNLIDRLVRGEVIDFLDVYIAPSALADWMVARFGTAHWPTFNLADSSIVIGASLLLLSIFRPQPTEATDDSPASSPSAGAQQSL
jgi:signal peptidase II